MRIGTTPTFSFELPFEVSAVRTAKITFRQNRTIILEKKEDCKLEGNVVKISLTQEETFLFDPRFKMDVQLRVVTVGNDALSSDIYSAEVEECLDREVL